MAVAGRRANQKAVELGQLLRRQLIIPIHFDGLVALPPAEAIQKLGVALGVLAVARSIDDLQAARLPGRTYEIPSAGHRRLGITPGIAQQKQQNSDGNGPGHGRSGLDTIS